MFGDPKAFVLLILHDPKTDQHFDFELLQLVQYEIEELAALDHFHINVVSMDLQESVKRFVHLLSYPLLIYLYVVADFEFHSRLAKFGAEIQDRLHHMYIR